MKNKKDETDAKLECMKNKIRDKFENDAKDRGHLEEIKKDMQGLKDERDVWYSTPNTYTLLSLYVMALLMIFGILTLYLGLWLIVLGMAMQGVFSIAYNSARDKEAHLNDLLRIKKKTITMLEERLRNF